MTPDYLAGCHRPYERRAVRYRLAAAWMILNGLNDTHRIVDLGAGRMELLRCLRNEFNWSGRYVPIDKAHDGADLADRPIPEADFYVALELLEHLPRGTCYRVVAAMATARIGSVVTVPNPAVQNIREMDDTHINEVDRLRLELLGYDVTEVMLYDGYYSQGRPDALFATRKENPCP